MVGLTYLRKYTAASIECWSSHTVNGKMSENKATKSLKVGGVTFGRKKSAPLSAISRNRHLRPGDRSVSKEVLSHA
ncbi:MAG: hypothetical protein ACRCZZ_08850 [Phocaeicola sp.]